MGNGRSIKRQVNPPQKANSSVQVLANILGDFYEFLSAKEKPSNEAVRERFLKDQNDWVEYCTANKLTEESKELFKINVNAMWEKRKSKQ